MAQVDYFLKIAEAPGESQDAKHPDEIQVLSWGWGASNTGTMSYGGGGGAGKVSVHDFSFTMKFNKASPKLFLLCCNGKHINNAILTCRKQGEKQLDYLIYTFSDLTVSSYQTGGHEGGDPIPTDSISLNFAKLESAYCMQKLNGDLDSPIKTGYDLKKMEKV